MSERTWNLVDKSAWPEGPWKSEPDKVQWVDEATGLDCLAVRNTSLGHWCGYVGVAEGHPLFGQDEEKADVSVHGGLTFSDFCNEKNADAVCHVPEPGRPEKVWWLGFDCAHAGDLSCFASPLPRLIGINRHDTYRDLAYVKAECRDLARQLAGVAS